MARKRKRASSVRGDVGRPNISFDRQLSSKSQPMSKGPSASNTPAESSTSTPALSDTDLERLLNREASAIQRELEVERILNAFKLKSVSLFFFSLICSV